MKKFFVSLLVIMCGAMPLFADDAADVKAVIVKDLELVSGGKFEELLALRTPDFVEESHGSTNTLEQMKWLVAALDGNHPEEFALLMVTDQNRGKTPSVEEVAEIRREAARSPEFIRQYKAQVAEMVSMLKTNATFQLKALRIIDIKVDGDSAVAVVEYDTKLVGTSKCRARFTFRKVNGEWKMCRSVVEAAK